MICKRKLDKKRIENFEVKRKRPNASRMLRYKRKMLIFDDQKILG